VPSLHFKYFTDAYFMGKLHPKLKEIFNFIVHKAEKEGWELEVTSTYRETGGVHQLYRGIDVVTVDRDTDKMERMRAWVNEEYDYGKDGIEVCPPIRHGSAPHCHLQSRDETTRRENAHI